MLPEVLARIRAACERAGRDPAGVTLVAVTKGRSAEEIRDKVLAHGSFPLGESRVQEALPKMEALPGADFHLIGHLQRNKARFTRGFSLIHSLDNERLADTLARQDALWGRPSRVLVEVRLADDGDKHGVEPAGAAGLVRHARQAGLDVRGLMTIAPYGDEAGARRAFRELRELRDSLGLEDLSMGMSDDYEAAVEAGATIVRVGRALYREAGAP
ncbi:MAG TPA: YggS family pyridoxal phosphate-dependent enzyme [Deinococcales bacterium]|nr:YggS family pyridoxal phosphate-dependent enzyme [Deinococcales bacterium]